MEEIQVTVVDSQEVVSLFVQTSTASVLSVNGNTGVVVLTPDEITGTKAQFDTAVTDGDFKYVGDAPTAHATSHTDGTDDIQSATNAQKGLATATHITSIEANNVKVTDEVSTASTGTVLSLTNKEGVLYNMSSANAATTYTTSGTTLNAYARVLINAAIEPTVTGGTKITGSDFVISTDMYMTVWYNGTAVQFWFEEI